MWCSIFVTCKILGAQNENCHQVNTSFHNELLFYYGSCDSLAMIIRSCFVSGLFLFSPEPTLLTAWQDDELTDRT